MENHPDIVQQHFDEDSPDYEKGMKEAVDIFMKARSAFESLTEADDGGCILRIELDANKEMNDAQFDEWFESETGFRNPQFDLDPKTMREVAAATETMGGGLDRCVQKAFTYGIIHESINFHVYSKSSYNS